MGNFRGNLMRTAVMPSQPLPMPKPGMPIRGHIPDTITDPNYAANTERLRQTAQVMPSSQPYGLSGASQALQGGVQTGLNQLNRGIQAGLGTLRSGFQAGQNYIDQGVSALANVPQARAGQVNTNAGQNMFRQGIQGLNQFTPAGAQAQQMQLALSGALGQEAFDRALIENPATQFLREQGLENTVNQASRFGGVGGGNILKELSRFNQGLAATELDNIFNRAGSITNQGLQAASNAGQLYGQAGSTQADLAGRQAGFDTQTSIANANQVGNQQRAIANMFSQGANMATDMASRGAGYQVGGGEAGANMFNQAGANLANLRTQAGRDIANQMGQTATGLSNLTNEQGLLGAELIRQAGGDINAAIQAAANAGNQTQLAAILANISQGQASQVADTNQYMGGVLGQNAANQAAIARARGNNWQNVAHDIGGGIAYGARVNNWGSGGNQSFNPGKGIGGT